MDSITISNKKKKVYFEWLNYYFHIWKRMTLIIDLYSVNNTTRDIQLPLAQWQLGSSRPPKPWIGLKLLQSTLSTGTCQLPLQSHKPTKLSRSPLAWQPPSPLGLIIAIMAGRRDLEPQVHSAALTVEAADMTCSDSALRVSLRMQLKLCQRQELKMLLAGSSARRFSLPDVSGIFPLHLIQLTTNTWQGSVDSSAPLFTWVSKTYLLVEV